jgi:HK97 family phage prohead protease
LKNPVFLWAHQSTSPPIGKTVALAVESNALIQTVEFASKETYPFADTAYNLYKNGFLNAVSVGFRPTEKPKPIRDPSTDQITGFEFVGQELLELSAVPIPANPNACMRAISEGIITRADAGKFFREKIDDPALALEFDLAQISLERVRLTLLELQVKNLLSELRGGAVPPPASEAIKDLGQLEAALRGRVN